MRGILSGNEEGAEVQVHRVQGGPGIQRGYNPGDKEPGQGDRYAVAAVSVAINRTVANYRIHPESEGQ